MWFYIPFNVLFFFIGFRSGTEINVRKYKKFLIFFLEFTLIYLWTRYLKNNCIKNSQQKFDSLIPRAGESKGRRYPIWGRWETLPNKTNLLLPFKMKSNLSSHASFQLRGQAVMTKNLGNSHWGCRAEIWTSVVFQLVQNGTWLELTASWHWACSFSLNLHFNKVGKNASFYLFTSILITPRMFYYMRACNCGKYSSDSTEHQSWVGTHFLHQVVPSQ